MSSTSWTGVGQNQQDSNGGSLSNVLQGYDIGGLHGPGLIPIQVAQFALINENYLIAKNYFDINVQDFDFFTSTYEPTMLSALTEAMGRPAYDSGYYLPQYGKLDYNASTGRAASIGARKLDRQWYATRRRMQRYHVGAGRWMDYKFAVERVQESLNGWNLGFRYEDHRNEIYNEQRHAHRTNILNLGIGVGNAARAGLATSVSALSDARATASSQLGKLGDGLASSSSFKSTQKGLQSISPSGLATQTQGLQNAGIYQNGSSAGSDVSYNPSSNSTAPQRNSSY